MTRAALTLLLCATIAAAQDKGPGIGVGPVRILEDGVLNRDAADALQVGMQALAAAAPATVAAARGDGALMSTVLTVDPGAVQVHLTVPEHAFHVEPMVVNINVVGLSPEAIDALGPWLVKATSVATDNIASPLAQIGSDFERGMASRGDRLEGQLARLYPWLVSLVVALIVLAGAATWERLTDNRSK